MVQYWPTLGRARRLLLVDALALHTPGQQCVQLPLQGLLLGRDPRETVERHGCSSQPISAPSGRPFLRVAEAAVVSAESAASGSTCVI